jgi:hypothetical protein
MSDSRAFAIYAKLVSVQQKLASSQARILSAANIASSTGPIGAGKAQALFSAASTCIAVNEAIVAAINAIQEKQELREALDLDLSSPVFVSLPLKNVYSQFGNQIDAITAMMETFSTLLDAARDTVSGITDVIAQHTLSSEPAYPVGSITGVVVVTPLPPVTNPPVPVVAPLPTPPPPTTTTSPGTTGGTVTDPSTTPSRFGTGGRVLQGA